MFNKIETHIHRKTPKSFNLKKIDNPPNTFNEIDNPPNTSKFGLLLQTPLVDSFFLKVKTTYES